MPVSITLGKYNTEFVTAAEDLELPVLDDVAAMKEVTDQMKRALEKALERKTGVVVHGPKGVGKTIALARAISAHKESEQELVAKNPSEYRERRLLEVHGLSSKTGRDLVMALLKIVSPGVRDRNLGMRKTDDDLRAELVAALMNKKYRVLVFDEAEYLSERAVDQLRQIMSDAASRESGRVKKTKDGEKIITAGVGVLLVGTKEVLEVVSRNADAGHRWADDIALQPLAPDMVGDCYRQYFPAFRSHIDQIGLTAWRDFCANHVAVGRRITADQVDQHARNYYSAYLSSELADALPSAALEHVPFNRELFLYSLQDGELSKPTSAKRKS
jgi:hypothetical protein